jgi:hypothetical protein
MAEDSKGMASVTTLEAIADKVARGGTLADGEASLILDSYDLIAIGTMADEVRRRLHGTETTFVRVLEMHVDAVPGSVPAGTTAGEFRIVGRPESVDRACEAVAAARKLAGAAPLFGFSLADPSGPTEFERLRTAGLDGIAETPVDMLDGAGAVEQARAAGLAVLRLTVHSSARDPLSILTRARELQRAAGGFRAFAPLPRSVPISAPTTGYDDVKLVALARVMCPEIPSIQVDWPLYGPKLAQVALTVGADDVDGIAAADSGALGARRSAIEEIKRNIKAAGLQPVERTGAFTVLAEDANGSARNG